MSYVIKTVNMYKISIKKQEIKKEIDRKNIES